MVRPLLALVAIGFFAVLSIHHARGDETIDELLQRAEKLANAAESGKAVAVLDEAIGKNPKTASAYYLRGRELFRIGKVRESAADFDRYVELRPDLASRQWERGISLYFAGEFEKGAKQFESYQTFHNNDVENSVWRYLCMARSVGVEKARAAILPIENDRRVPMMQIYELYRGKLKPEDVLSAAKAGEATEGERNARLFYAHLYLGLYQEAAGNLDAAKTHIEAADKHKIGHYMWDVAHIHAERLRNSDRK